MSDAVSAAGGGVVGAAFIAGVQWAKSVINGNGNGKKEESDEKYVTRLEYEARHQDIRESLRRIEDKVDRIRV